MDDFLRLRITPPTTKITMIAIIIKPMLLNATMVPTRFAPLEDEWECECGEP